MKFLITELDANGDSDKSHENAEASELQESDQTAMSTLALDHSEYECPPENSDTGKATTLPVPFHRGQGSCTSRLRIQLVEPFPEPHACPGCLQFRFTFAGVDRDGACGRGAHHAKWQVPNVDRGGEPFSSGADVETPVGSGTPSPPPSWFLLQSRGLGAWAADLRGGLHAHCRRLGGQREPKERVPTSACRD